MRTLVALGVLSVAPLASAQEAPSAFADRFRYGVQVTANYAPHDGGYFNEIQYDRNGLQLLRLSLALELEASEHLSFLGEIRTDNLDVPEPYALYARVRPFRDRPFHVQVGRIPPVFGAFARRRYDYENPLIGYPLAYQYRTVVRADAAPATVRELLEQRGRGAKTYYTVGSRELASGVPLLEPLQWDTGIEVKVGDEPVQLAVALTQGTNANPRVRDDNSGKQIAGRLGLRPTFGWTVGLSGARGDYLSDEVREDVDGIGESTPFHQTSFGFDTELARGFWILRAEGIWTRFESTLPDGPFEAFGWMLEGRYKLFPGFYVAGRFDRMSFSGVGAAPTEWDAPVRRLEVGVGYDVIRHLRTKFSLQWNERDGGPSTSALLPAIQAIFWF